MIARRYKHKEFICGCDPNYAVGDELVYADETPLRLPNHRDPRNEWTALAAKFMEYHCVYCDQDLVANPRAGEIEELKNGKRGSWQTNKPKSKKEQE